MTAPGAAAKETRQYFAVSLFLMLATNRLLFPLGHFLGRFFPTRDLSLPADALFPFLTWTIAIYCGVFAWWLYIFWLTARRGRDEADRFFAANLLGKAVCLAFFALLPTSAARPAVSGNTIWDAAVRLLFAVDTPDNLFPSVHCFLGWLCYIVVRGKKDVPLRRRVLSLLLAFAVCLSTLTLRQHVLADVAGGILLAELCWALCARPALRGGYGRLADRLCALCFGRKNDTSHV